MGVFLTRSGQTGASGHPEEEFVLKIRLRKKERNRGEWSKSSEKEKNKQNGERGMCA